jgi:uncharacterized protein YciW
VDFAQSLTARPWTIGPADIRQLSAAGFSRQSIVLVIGLVAMFNYLTRVADGTGVEADYNNGLPQFEYRGVTEAAPRPGPQEWPAVDRSLESLSVFSKVHAAWSRWQDYIFEGSGPVPTEIRHRLRFIAARNACDGAIASSAKAGSQDTAWSRTESGEPLSQFAEKLSRTPWLMGASDADALRSIGLDDLSILHVIAIVAYQSAESRLRIGLSALSRSGV